MNPFLRYLADKNSAHRHTPMITRPCGLRSAGKNGKNKKIETVVKRKLEQMSFESTAEGRVDGADRCRKTVPHVGTADRESPSSELGPSSLYRGGSGLSGAELPMRVG